MQVLLTPELLKPYRTRAHDYEETEDLKASFRELRAQRSDFHLTAAELEGVFRWKLGKQYGRQAKRRAGNAEEAYVSLTRAAFSLVTPDPDRQLIYRTRILCCLDGVGVPVASAILALTDPDACCVIDFRGWRAMFGDRRDSFEVGRYVTYRRAVAGLARPLGWSVQETDLAVWALDAERNP